VEPFRIHVADEVLDDLRARLGRTRWPDQVAGIGWKQGTELDWLRHLVSYWTREFDWRVWEQRLNTLDHFTWDECEPARRLRCGRVFWRQRRDSRVTLSHRRQSL
jgi:hypothetical protein